MVCKYSVCKCFSPKDEGLCSIPHTNQQKKPSTVVSTYNPNNREVETHLWSSSATSLGKYQVPEKLSQNTKWKAQTELLRLTTSLHMPAPKCIHTHVHKNMHSPQPQAQRTGTLPGYLCAPVIPAPQKLK